MRSPEWKRCHMGWLSACLLWFTGLFLATLHSAAQVREIDAGGIRITGEDVTGELVPLMRGMRWNEALEEWNLDLAVTNTGGRVFPLPVFVVVESLQNSEGTLEADGLTRDGLSRPAYLALESRPLVRELGVGGVTVARTIRLKFQANAGAPKLGLKVYGNGRGDAPSALGFARTLTGEGLPLPGVRVLETRLTGNQGGTGERILQSDTEYGVVTLGGSPGTYQWRFESDQAFPVWRRAELVAGQVQVLPSPRLTARPTLSTTLGPLGGVISDGAGGRLKVPPGVLNAPTALSMTRVDLQSLPALLPVGWSPMSAFWVSGSGVLAFPVGVVATVTPAGLANAGEPLALVRLEEPNAAWKVVHLGTGRGTNSVEVPVPGTGAYVLVVADSGVTAPPSPQVGQSLPSSASPLPSESSYSAVGQVQPSRSSASRIAEQVTATAAVQVTSSNAAVPSGVVFRGRVRESYRMQDGTGRFVPSYEHHWMGYQKPGDGLDRTVQATFPMRPVLLFGNEELAEAVITTDLLNRGGFEGGVFPASGGVVEAGGIRVKSRAGDFSRAQAAVLTVLNGVEFAGLLGSSVGVSVVAAFDLAVGPVEGGRALGLEVSRLTGSRSYVLARVVTQQGLSGLEPVERMETTAGGLLVSLEPATGERLRGIQGAGQYVLVQVPSRQTLVVGLVVDAAGEAALGFPVRMEGLPWLTFVGGDASYRLVAPAGTVRVAVSNPSTGESDIREIVAKENVLGVVPTLETVDRGPRVVELQPGDGAQRVSLVTSVVLRWSEALRLETVMPGSVQLLGSNGVPVAASISLGGRGTQLTLLPERPLGGGETYRVLLAQTLTDLTGHPVEGQREFTFTTRSDVARAELARLTIFEPGATNLVVDGVKVKEMIPAFDQGSDRAGRVVAYGSPGTADGLVPVILVNETSGETSTVLSKADGSFAGFVRAGSEDFVSAVFVNVNGTRTTVAASRQKFDDGRVGLYQPGGILEAESDGGTIQVLVEPNAVETRSTFKIAAMKTQEVLAAVNQTPPVNARLLGGLRVELGGDAMAEGAGSNVSIPLDPAKLNLPPGESVEDGVFALAIPRTVNGETAYQVVDKLKFKDGKLESNTLPFLGFLAVLLAENAAQEAAIQGGGIILAYLFVGNQQIVITGKTLQTVEVPNPLNASFAPTRLNKPLSGVQVTAAPVGVGLGNPGRIGAGTIFSTSGNDGVYALVVARKAFLTGAQFKDYLMSATHPAFGDTPNNVLDTSFGTPAVEYDFVFSDRLNAGSLARQPRITTSVTPRYPALGEPAELKIIAEHLHGPPSVTTRIVPESVVSLVPGVSVGADSLQMSLVEEVEAGRKKISRYRLIATNALQASIRIVAVRTLGQSVFRSEALEFVQVGAGVPVVPEVLAPADPGDVTGPTVVGTFPQQNGMLSPGERLAITFNEPIQRSITNDSIAVGLASSNGNAPGLQLSEDQKTLFVTPGLLSPGIVQELILTTAIRDLAGNPLKKTAAAPEGASHSVRFTVTPLVKKSLTDLQQGGGAVVNKGFVFALERSGENGAGQLVVYDLATVLAGNNLLPVPAVARRTIAAGFPRDLTLIPQYSFRRKPGGAVETKDLLAVVAGTAGVAGEDERGTIPLGQLLRVFDISDPKNPTLIMGARLSLRSGVVNVVRWSPPHLTYLESGVDLQQVGIIDLQEMIIGFLATPAEAEAFPLFGVKGKDNNGDGDYVDEGDQFPLPEKTPTEFFGKKMGLVVEGTTQLIQDYDYLPTFELGVGILNRGKARNSQGEPVGADLPPSLRVLLANGSFVNPPSGVVRFDMNLRPQRVFLLPGQDLVVNGLGQTMNLALVGLSSENGGAPVLAVCDVTFPNNPTLLGQIQLPASSGIPKSMVRLKGGLISLFTAEHQILIDPSRLLFPAPPGLMLHPSIVSVNKGAGSGNRTLAPTDYGLNAVSLGSRNEVQVSAPRIQFVHFPASTGVIQPGQLVDNPVALTNEFGFLRSPGVLQLARVETVGGAVSSLSPPTPVAHYHVLVEAPGQAGPSLLVAVESLNEAGHPLKNLGPLFPPVRAASGTTLAAMGQAPREGRDAPVGVMRALRLSSDPTSPFFNRYLTQPFVLVSEKIKTTVLADLKATVPREILWSGALVRATLDPETGLNGVVGAFASVVDDFTKLIRPGVSALAVTIQGHYLFGPNPPPVDGELALPGTFGMVNAGNGEFRTSTVDMELPSRRMPIVFSRSYGGQDLFDGPFGRGWDFLYGQKLIEYQAQAFPEGSKKPLVIRALESSGVTVESGDVVFQTGEARIILFKRVKGAVPPGLTNDPLLKDTLKWFDAPNGGATYYLPAPGEKGVFDVLCRFPGGEFCRVTPEGQQFWYSGKGRLERIYDKYPKNRHVLVYNDRSELVKVVDESVSSDRYLRIGYYRLASDGAMNSDVDVVTSSTHLAGRIAKLKDYTETEEREVLFEYHERGTLERRLGYKLAGVNGGFGGRPVTTYTWDAGGRYLVGVVQGNGSNGGGAGGGNAGTPLFSVKTEVNEKDAAVATGGQGAGGELKISVPVAGNLNSAANSASLISGTKTAENGTSETSFDGNGYPRRVTLNGPGEVGEVEFQTDYDDQGRPRRAVSPEGSITTYDYFATPPTFRSTANVRVTTVDPGPRGGETLVSRFDGGYDLRYNQPTGQMTDYNGLSREFRLRADGRDVEEVDYRSAGQHRVQRNDYGQVEVENGMDGQRLEYGIDPSSGFVKSVKRGGLETIYGYESQGGFSQSGALGMAGRISPPRGASATLVWDSRLMVTETSRGGFSELMGYDENGNMVFLRRTLGGGQQYEEERVYDQASFLREVRVKDVEVGGSARVLKTTFTPDNMLRVRSITYPDGKVRSFQHDHLGHVTRMSIGSAVDADDYHEEYGRDRHGNLLSTKTRGELTQTMVYDGHDRPVSIRNQLGGGAEEIITKSYFGGGEERLLKIAKGGEVNLEREVTLIDSYGRPKREEIRGDQASGIRTFDYAQQEDGGMVITISGPRDVTVVAMDAAGRVRSTSGGLGSVTYTHDGNDNVTRIKAEESGQTYIRDYTFDDLDQPLTDTDSMGEFRRYEPRLDGMPRKVFDGRGNASEMEYTVLGELKRLKRPGGIQFQYQFDEQRFPRKVLDGSGGGNVSSYDEQLRLTRLTVRSGESFVLGNFDPRNRAQSIALPGGGSIQRPDGYDRLGRLIAQDTISNGENFKMTDASYDALDRLRFVKYGSDAQHSMEFKHDKLGPVVSETVKYNPGGSFRVDSLIDSDASRKQVTYPSGVVVQEVREPSGRLKTLKADGGTIWDVQSFKGSAQPGVVLLGGLVRESNTYDERRRLVQRRYELAGDGALLAEMRFLYDGENNLLARQWVHRQGRADLFRYDAANRLVSVEYGARPNMPGAVRLNSAGLAGGEGLAAGWGGRVFSHDGGGLDLLLGGGVAINPSGVGEQGAVGSVPPGFLIPMFAKSLGGHDSFLHARELDGTSRGGTDGLGNILSSVFAVRPNGASRVVKQRATTIKHNALNQLVSLEFEDGRRLSYEYRPDGLLQRRTLKLNGNLISDRVFVWDQSKMIEEREIGVNPRLLGRYYYADRDWPVAVDLADSAGDMKRHFIVYDNVSSVVGLLDAVSGAMVEQASYEAWGQPVIESRDVTAPRIARIQHEGSGALLVQWTEPIFPRLNVGSGNGDGILKDAPGLEGLLRVTQGGSPIAGEIRFVEDLPGAVFGSSVRFVPDRAVSGALSIDAAANRLVDTWGNGNVAETVSVNLAGAGVVFTGSLASTAAQESARSLVGNPFLFQGQWFDYDSGLVYMRARWYDPYTGQFLERDPMEYEDSVNLYAALGGNPVSERDPSGRLIGFLRRLFARPQVFGKSGAESAEKIFAAMFERGAAEDARRAAALVKRGARTASSPVGPLSGRKQDFLNRIAQGLQSTERVGVGVGDFHPDVLHLAGNVNAGAFDAMFQFMRSGRTPVRFASMSLAESGHYAAGVINLNRFQFTLLRSFGKQAEQISTVVHEMAHAFVNLGQVESGLLRGVGNKKFVDEFMAEISAIAGEMKILGRNPASKSRIRGIFERGGYPAVARDVASRYASEIGDLEKVFPQFKDLH